MVERQNHPFPKSLPETSPDFQIYLKEHLELPRAILSQLRDTCLFNEMIEQAIKDIDEILSEIG